MDCRKQRAGILVKLPIFIDDKKDISIEEIETKCRNISNSNKKDCLGLIVIDCCHMMEYLNHLITKLSKRKF